MTVLEHTKEFDYTYTSEYGIKGTCHMRVEPYGWQVVVICSDSLEDEDSITNNVENIAKGFMIPGGVDIYPELNELIWIEHYPAEWIGGELHQAIYDFVFFQQHGDVTLPMYYELELLDWYTLGLDVPADFPGM